MTALLAFTGCTFLLAAFVAEWWPLKAGRILTAAACVCLALWLVDASARPAVIPGLGEPIAGRVVPPHVRSADRPPAGRESRL